MCWWCHTADADAGDLRDGIVVVVDKRDCIGDDELVEGFRALGDRVQLLLLLGSSLSLSLLL